MSVILLPMLDQSSSRPPFLVLGVLTAAVLIAPEGLAATPEAKIPAPAVTPVTPAIESAPALETAPAQNADAFYARVRDHYQPMFARFEGTETLVEQLIELRDSDSGRIKKRKRVKLRTRDYFYQDREVEVLEAFELSYKAGGTEKKLPPGDYKVRGSKAPLLPLFDAKGPTHYRVKLEAPAQKLGHRCEVLRFLPRKNTSRHFAGKAWIDRSSLNLIAIEGKIADTPFGVDDLKVRYAFRQEGPVVVSTGGQVKVWVDVPIFFPDNLIVIDSTVLSARGLPKAKAPMTRKN